ncbi:helix-turn-helix domain-containing protein [Loigolactobacillus bifermentans]|jgi:transcriptional regulator with XRE-family HTH domain|uniref:HTH cro/C1-type domain-containing protein n=1 Tax=Loigolactobacillus bifermentans DSM 20003 TaxID=1423726 RepID=A0A0R1H2R8_9LACO|nr:helix-turn-helix transcriptional regulator [Loigolactobacillus bifermentans]KRK40843.1 hypothetical protein FC07_GL002595 [Loigolactobacillus bifermentans DSM 20003]QGG59595.1 helix-turn-helix domain-containing protein [Loigolactobacillus bifermentans]
MYLKKVRTDLNLTQKEFAKRLGYSKSHYSKVEGGFVKPSYDFLLKVYNETNCDMNGFFKKSLLQPALE